MPENTKNSGSQKHCFDCGEELLQRNPDKCPYCGSQNMGTKKEYINHVTPELERLKKAGKYEDAALKYDALEMWDEAEAARKKVKTSDLISENVNFGKVASISMECPRCGKPQTLSSKNNKVKCKRCGKTYAIPKKVLDLL